MRTFFSALFTLVLVLGARQAAACSCAPVVAPDKALVQAAAVFLGKAVKVESPSSQPIGGEVHVKFQVDRFWKGVASRDVVVGTWSNGAMCGYGFQEGENYLVYAHIDSQGRLQTSLCSRTRLEADADEDLSVLGEGQIPSSLVPDSFSDALLAAN